ncbi:MAG TPA: phage tail protein [Promineifilum sp.]|nr:phage tail protein [Promineifilum sp.]
MTAPLDHQLLISGGEGRPRIFALPLGETLIGNEPEAAVHLPSADVSPQHARLECTPTGCLLTDLGSDSGTWMGRRRLEAGKPVNLGHGVVFRIGPYELTYRQVQIRPETQPQPEPPPERKGKAEPQSKESKDAKQRKKPAPAGGESASRGVPPVASPLSPSRYSVNPAQPPPGLDFHSVKLIEHLPGIYHTDFMERFLAVFEAMLLPMEWTVDNFDLYLDPATSPAAFLPWLAGWFDIVFDDTWSDHRRRLLLGEAHVLYARRGTKFALSRILEIYTGDKPEIIDVGEDQLPDTFTVRLPRPAEQYDRLGIEKLIESAKPAHTRYTLVFSSR